MQIYTKRRKRIGFRPENLCPAPCRRPGRPTSAPAAPSPAPAGKTIRLPVRTSRLTGFPVRLTGRTGTATGMADCQTEKNKKAMIPFHINLWDNSWAIRIFAVNYIENCERDYLSERSPDNAQAAPWGNKHPSTCPFLHQRERGRSCRKPSGSFSDSPKHTFYFH